MLERGRYGVEWTPQKPKDTSGLGRVVVIVVSLALVSLVWTGINRIRTRLREKAAEAPQQESSAPLVPSPAPSLQSEPLPVEPAYRPPETTELGKRPPKVRNLLMRLEEAEKRRDVEMAVTTIEQIRALPGSPAADLDNSLARRLGTLNMRRLFVLKCAQWVSEVNVKRGDSASRIAAEHGSTLASLQKLNDGRLDALKMGQSVFVLNHPRFALVVRRRTRTADLQLNGKFFKRYDLPIDVTGDDGAYEVTVPIRPFWRTVGLDFLPADRAEIELLMPKGASVIISEM